MTVKRHRCQRCLFVCLAERPHALTCVLKCNPVENLLHVSIAYDIARSQLTFRLDELAEGVDIAAYNIQAGGPECLGVQVNPKVRGQRGGISQTS